MYSLAPQRKRKSGQHRNANTPRDFLPKIAQKVSEEKRTAQQTILNTGDSEEILQNPEGPVPIASAAPILLQSEDNVAIAEPVSTQSLAPSSSQKRMGAPAHPTQANSIDKRRVLSVRRVKLFAGPKVPSSNASDTGGWGWQGAIEPRVLKSAAEPHVQPLEPFDVSATLKPVGLRKVQPFVSPRNVTCLVLQVTRKGAVPTLAQIDVTQARGLNAADKCAQVQRPTTADFSPSAHQSSMRPPPAVPPGKQPAASGAGAPTNEQLTTGQTEQSATTAKTPKATQPIASQDGFESWKFAPLEWKHFSATPSKPVHLELKSSQSSVVAESFQTYSPRANDSELGGHDPSKRSSVQLRRMGGLFPAHAADVAVQSGSSARPWPEDMSAPDSPRAGDAASHYSFYRASVEAHIDELQRNQTRTDSTTGSSAHHSNASRSKASLSPPSNADPTERESASTQGSGYQTLPIRHVDLDVSIRHQRGNSSQNPVASSISHPGAVEATPSASAGLDAAAARLRRLLSRVRTLGTKLPRKVGTPLKNQLTLASRCLKVARSAPATPASIAEVDECIDGVLLAVTAAEAYMAGRSRAGSSASSVVSSAETSLSAELDSSNAASGSQQYCGVRLSTFAMPTVREAEIETPSNRRQGLSPPTQPLSPVPRSNTPSCASFNPPSPSFTAGGVSATWEAAPNHSVQLADPSSAKWLKRTASTRSKATMSDTSATSDSSAAGSVASGHRKHRRHRSGKVDSSTVSGRHRGGYVYSHESKTLKRSRTKHEIMRRTNLAEVTQDVFLSPKVNIKTGKKPAFTF